jgi:ribose 5-phosphate isomerase A
MITFKGVPIEVHPSAYVPIMKKIENSLHGKPNLRMAEPKKAGPVVTDNGNFVLDVDFGQISDPESLNGKLSLIPGIIETGLFVNMAEQAYFGQQDGKVVKLDKK